MNAGYDRGEGRFEKCNMRLWSVAHIVKSCREGMAINLDMTS